MRDGVVPVPHRFGDLGAEQLRGGMDRPRRFERARNEEPSREAEEQIGRCMAFRVGEPARAEQAIGGKCPLDFGQPFTVLTLKHVQRLRGNGAPASEPRGDGAE